MSSPCVALIPHLQQSVLLPLLVIQHLHSATCLGPARGQVRINIIKTDTL